MYPELDKKYRIIFYSHNEMITYKQDYHFKENFLNLLKIVRNLDAYFTLIGITVIKEK